MKRRNFFQMLGLTAGGMALAQTKLLNGKTPPILRADDLKKTLNKESGDSYWKLIREQFLFPKDYSYLNTGGLGASPLVVQRRVKEMMDRENTFPAAGHDLEDWEVIKKKCAKLLGPGVSAGEIALIGSATEGINTILNGLPLEQGDEIIASTHEHVALHIPLLYKKKTMGIVPRWFEPDLKNGAGNVKKIRASINKRTRLIFISHVTTTTGQVFPVKEIGALAKERGILFALDGAQAAGQLPVDLKDMGVDFYTFSGHKWLLGPKRTGVLYVRGDKINQLRPTMVGAYSNGKFDFQNEILELQKTAQRFEYGTQNDALYYGLGEALDFIDAIGVDKISRHNTKLAELFLEGLRQLPKAKVDILSPSQQVYRSGLITFRMKDTISSLVCRGAEEENGFRLRYVSEAGMEAVRVSFHLFNHEAQVHRLLEFLRSLT